VGVWGFKGVGGIFCVGNDFGLGHYGLLGFIFC
jgi:hypothetical protein